MCIRYFRHFKCCEDIDRLPGQPIPGPTSGRWPYETNSPTHFWPTEGKNHSKWFIVQCAHPSYPEGAVLGSPNSHMCFAALNHGRGLGVVEQWFDEPCPDCNSLSEHPEATLSSPVRTRDVTSFEPTDWSGVSVSEKRVIQRYADRLADLSAHAFALSNNNRRREAQPVVVDPYWSSFLRRAPVDVTVKRVRVALRELTCSVDAYHGPLFLPKLVEQVYDPGRFPGLGCCRCLRHGRPRDMLPVTFNAALNSRRQLAAGIMSRIDQNCALERWPRHEVAAVVTSAIAFKKQDFDMTVIDVPLAKRVQSRLPPHALVLERGLHLDETTSSARLRNLELFANELRANLMPPQVSDIHLNSHWEDWLTRLLADDSGLTLRWARMILWRILTDYWQVTVAQRFDPSSFRPHLLHNLLPSYHLAFLSEMWSANLVVAEGARFEEHIASLLGGLTSRAFHRIPENIAEELDRSRRLWERSGALADTVRATPDQLLAMLGGNDGDDCGICHDRLADHDVKLPRQPAKCLAAGANHWFGHTCLAQWVASCHKGHATCPSCRRPIGAPPPPVNPQRLLFVAPPPLLPVPPEDELSESEDWDSYGQDEEDEDQGNPNDWDSDGEDEDEYIAYLWSLFPGGFVPGVELPDSEDEGDEHDLDEYEGGGYEEYEMEEEW